MKYKLTSGRSGDEGVRNFWKAACKQSYSYHTSHDSVSVVRTTFKVYGKMQTLTLSQPKTPEPIVTKFEWRDYVADGYHQKNLGLIRPGVFAPHIGEIYAPPVRNLLHFFGSSTRLQASPLDRFLRLIRQMTRFCARKCHFIVIK